MASTLILRRQYAPIFSGPMLARNLSKDSSLLKMGRLNHIAIATNNLAGHLRVFGESFNLPIGPRTAQPEHGVYTTFVELGNTKIELLEPLGEHSPIAGFLKKNPNGGIHHFCYEVADINQAIKELAEKGIRPIDPEPRLGAHGLPVVFLHPRDCSGILTELEEVKPPPSAKQQ